jgi:hypothetical protein
MTNPFEAAAAAKREASLARLLDELVELVRSYVVMSEAQAAACALWIAHTHAFDAAEATPYLHVTSAEAESGKTRLLEVLELLVAKPIKTGGSTAAALARAASQDPPPSLLLDETDNAFRRDREYVAALLGILNDGYRRGGRTLLCLPPRWEPSYLNVFTPKAIAGLGRLPDTLASRAVQIRLKKRRRDETVKRWRQREVAAAAEPLRERLATWAEQTVEELAEARPIGPEDFRELRDRAVDVWEPLLAIAEAAGESWLARARAAALALSGEQEPDDLSIGVRLLADIKRAFDDLGARLSSQALIDALAADEEAPWGSWQGDGKITKRQLAGLLKKFGIKPGQLWIDGANVRGYEREQFDDDFLRYLPPSPQDGASKTLGPLDPAPRTGFSLVSQTLEEAALADRKQAANPHGEPGLADLADKPADTAERDPKLSFVGLEPGTEPEEDIPW